MDTQSTPQTVDAYIAAAPEAVRPLLREIRSLIRAVVPGAKERISWGMPTYTGRHNLVHFAAHKAHMGFYPGAVAMQRFQAELAEYKTSKGAIQFPYAKPLPADLIQEIVRFRAEEDGTL